LNIHGPSLGIGAGIAVISILVAFVSMNTLDSQPLVIEESSKTLTQLKAPEQPNNPYSFSSTLFTANASPYLGSVDAPITLVEFGDYQCAFCNKFFHITENNIIENYVNTGKLKIIFKDFIIIGPDSFTAAHGAHCADDQGRFWDFHDILYMNWTGEENGWASSENVHGFAQDLNLDMTQFSECMSDKRYQSMIAASTQDAKSLGITGTPAFFVINDNNQVIPIQGAQPYEVFERIFDSELQK